MGRPENVSPRRASEWGGRQIHGVMWFAYALVDEINHPSPTLAIKNWIPRGSSSIPESVLKTLSRWRLATDSVTDEGDLTEDKVLLCPLETSNLHTRRCRNQLHIVGEAYVLDLSFVLWQPDRCPLKGCLSSMKATKNQEQQSTEQHSSDTIRCYPPLTHQPT